MNDDRDPDPTGTEPDTEPKPERRNDDDATDPDAVRAPDDPSLTEYDKTIADSFPASDPPALP